MDEWHTLQFAMGVHDPVLHRNPAIDTVMEHLEVYRVLGSELSPRDKREHARRIVDAVLALQVKP